MTLLSIEERSQLINDLDHRRGWIVENIARAERAGCRVRVLYLLEQLNQATGDVVAEMKQIPGEGSHALCRRLFASRSSIPAGTPEAEVNAPFVTGKLT